MLASTPGSFLGFKAHGLGFGIRLWGPGTLLGGSWVDTSRVICRETILVTHIKGLITSLITTHEPPSIV